MTQPSGGSVAPQPDGQAGASGAARVAGRLGLVDRLTNYLVGRHTGGWMCHSCRREFAHEGRPRRTFLALLDHVVLDHHRLPLRWTRSRAQSVTNATWTFGTTITSGTTIYTLTLPLWAGTTFREKP